jgi:biopolymer transport protein ExbD
MARNVQGSSEELELNMTPMIDVVFNLIIFFMIVTDMTQKDIEQLKLPDSKASVEDKDDEDEVRMILNVIKDIEDDVKAGVRVEDALAAWPNHRKVLIKYKAKPYSLKALKTKLYEIAETRRNPEDPSGANPSEVYVLIRCDRDIPWKEVQWVMQACADPRVRIYKLQFATAEWAGED